MINVEIEINNARYIVWQNNEVFGNYASSAIALIQANLLTGLSYTDVNDYVVTTSAGVNNMQKNINTLMTKNNLYYDVSGVMTQAGSVAGPVLTIKENETGNTYTTAYVSDGSYTLNKITGNVVFTATTEIYLSGIVGFLQVEYASATQLTITCQAPDGTPADDLIAGVGFTFRIPR